MPHIEELIREGNRHGLALDQEVAALLTGPVNIAIGVSGGKDSDALALLLIPFLREIGQQGEVLLIHADLGAIEHADSLPQCRRLADKLGVELAVVRRAKGGMLERWEQRWADNCARYHNLSCVSLISPWSSADMRFCTSELKVAPITQALRRRWPEGNIINAVGIRREESTARALKPVSQINKALTRKDRRQARDWNAIADMKIEQVWLTHRKHEFQEHYAYRVNGNRRVSCSVCVLSSRHDLAASLRDENNHAAYRRAVALESVSSFSFQPVNWLADVRPDLLTGDEREGMRQAKERAAARRLAERRIPSQMRYLKGWPTYQPDITECEKLASARREVAALYGWTELAYTDAQSVYGRYAELLAEKERRGIETPAPESNGNQLSLF